MKTTFYICDRCGKDISKDSERLHMETERMIGDMSVAQFGDRPEWDLCKFCADALRMFLS